MSFAYRLLHCSNLILVGLLMKMQFETILFLFMSSWMVCDALLAVSVLVFLLSMYVLLVMRVSIGEMNIVNT